MKLLFATSNKGKVAELEQMVGGLLEVVSLDAFPQLPEVEETGTTFEDNAKLKALAYAQATGLIALADDSGLTVDALGGRPGVHSARYIPGSDHDRMMKVLEDVKGIPREKRGAAFVSVLCLATPAGRTWCTEGIVRGVLTEAPRGQNGFGYDPIFELPSGKTTAELAREEKAQVSHRGKAFRAMLPRLESLARGVIPE